MSTVNIQEQEDFYNAFVDGIVFTADKCDREWFVGYAESPPEEVERIARSRDMTPDAFWVHYRQLLNNAVGWVDARQ